jgi:hypothetical protein
LCLVVASQYLSGGVVLEGRYLLVYLGDRDRVDRDKGLPLTTNEGESTTGKLTRYVRRTWDARITEEHHLSFASKACEK